MKRNLARADIESPLVRELDGYWHGKLAGRAFPAKSDIDPAEIKRLLPNIFIAEIEQREPLRVRYRLTGTELVRFNEFDLTGKFLDQSVFETTLFGDLVDQYRRLIETGHPLYGIGEYESRDKSIVPYDWAKFPLGDAQDRLAYCIGIEDPRIKERRIGP